MVHWKQMSQPDQVELMGEGGSLFELGSLAEAPASLTMTGAA